jgi:hypothetical protein
MTRYGQEARTTVTSEIPVTVWTDLEACGKALGVGVNRTCYPAFMLKMSRAVLLLLWATTFVDIIVPILFLHNMFEAYPMGGKIG